jgi:hypothetical protein
LKQIRDAHRGVPDCTLSKHTPNTHTPSTPEENTVKSSTLALVAAIAFASGPVMANEIELTYTGIVSYAGGTTANSGYADGSAISGSLFVDTNTDVVTGATLGTFTAPNGVVPGSVAFTPSGSDVIFQQGQYVSNGDPLNNSVSVDLSSASGLYPITDIGALLSQDNATLNSQIDFTAGAPGQYLNELYLAGDGYGSAVTLLSAAGSATNQTEVVAYLESVTATPVPLPASAWLMFAGAAGLLGFARRRTAMV